MADTRSVPEQEKPAASPVLPDVASVGVGSALRMRREQLGWTLTQIADWLRIREAYLEALESGRAGVFPAEAYALGFLRTYAQALGFDAEDVVQRYKREGKVRNRKPELTFPAPPPDRRIPPGVTVSLGLLVLVGAYVGWYQFVGHAPPVPEHVPPVAEIIPGEKTANAPSPQVASILPDPGASPPPQPAPAPASGAPLGGAEHSAPAIASNDPLAPSAQGATEQASGLAGGTEGVSSPAANTPPPSSDSAEGSESTGVDANQLVLKADAASWVQVKDGAGKVVYDHIMQPGDQWDVPPESGPYSLTVGNAGGVMVAAGSVTTPHLGRNGAVRRKLPLTVDAVRDGSLAGAPVSGVVTSPSAASSVPAAPSLPAAGLASQQSSSKPQQQNNGSQPEDVPSSTLSAGGKAASSSAQPDQDGVVQENAPAMPVHSMPRRKSSPPPETSADDLNARQLQGLGGH